MYLKKKFKLNLHFLLGCPIFSVFVICISHAQTFATACDKMKNNDFCQKNLICLFCENRHLFPFASFGKWILFTTQQKKTQKQQSCNMPSKQQSKFANTVFCFLSFISKSNFDKVFLVQTSKIETEKRSHTIKVLKQ